MVLAVPVAPPGWQALIGGDADELVCVDTPEPFYAIGQFYADFTQTTDDEVVGCLHRAATPDSATPDSVAMPARRPPVTRPPGMTRLRSAPGGAAWPVS